MKLILALGIGLAVGVLLKIRGRHKLWKTVVGISVCALLVMALFATL